MNKGGGAKMEEHGRRGGSRQRLKKKKSRCCSIGFNPEKYDPRSDLVIGLIELGASDDYGQNGE